MVYDIRRTSRPTAAITQRACAWCGLLVVLFCVLGLAVCAQFVPPPSPEDTPADIAETLREDTTGIRVGMMLVVVGAAFLCPFFAVISAHMRRIEGPRPTLTYLQLIFGACFTMEIIFPIMAVQTAAYRPDRDDAISQALNDYAWLTFFGVASTAFVQMVIIGALILQDTSAKPVFPRWAGYFNFWVGLAFTPGTACVFVKDGPLAWTGVFVFWIPFTAFFAWLVVMAWLVLKAVDHETAEEAESAIPTEPSGEQLGALHHQVAVLTDELHDLRERLARVERDVVP